jgi:hypothetical protein
VSSRERFSLPSTSIESVRTMMEKLEQSFEGEVEDRFSTSPCEKVEVRSLSSKTCRLAPGPTFSSLGESELSSTLSRRTDDFGGPPAPLERAKPLTPLNFSKRFKRRRRRRARRGITLTWETL